MSKLDFDIPSSAFELFRDRIYDILVDEIEAQPTLPPITIFCERNINFSDADLLAINVRLGNIDYSGKHQGQSTGNNLFFIECYAKAKTTGTQRGDYTSAKLCQRLAGVCRYILEDTRYNTLGYAKPFVESVKIRGIRIADNPGTMENGNISMIRLELEVVCAEINSLVPPRLMEGFETQIKIAESESGYFSTSIV